MYLNSRLLHIAIVQTQNLRVTTWLHAQLTIELPTRVIKFWLSVPTSKFLYVTKCYHPVSLSRLNLYSAALFSLYLHIDFKVIEHILHCIFLRSISVQILNPMYIFSFMNLLLLYCVIVNWNPFLSFSLCRSHCHCHVISWRRGITLHWLRGNK